MEQKLTLSTYCKKWWWGGHQLHQSNLAALSSQLKALLKLLQYQIYSKCFKVNSASP